MTRAVLQAAMTLTLLLGAAAVAQEHGATGTEGTTGTEGHAAPATDGHENVSIPDYIIHHVSDSNEIEWEVPLRTHGANPVWHLPQIFVPLSGKGCPAPVADAHGADAAKPPFYECLDLSITKHTVMMWFASILLILVFWFVPHRNKADVVPRGKAANFIEMLVLFVRDEIAIKNIGKEHGPKYTSYLLTAFFFILFLNFLGLFPFMATATANLAVTVSLATLTFVITQVAAIRTAGLGTYLKHLTGGVHWLLWPIMIPVEVLGLFTKPFALTMRLFANMLAGHIVIFFLLGLIFILNNAALAIVSVPLAMAIYFLEIFVAFVQAFIFTMLSALFIGMGVAMAHHDEHDAHDKGHGHTEGSHSHDHGKAHALGS